MRIALQEQLAKEPFEPFRIRLVSGDHHDIYDPDLFILYTHEEKCFYATSDGHWVIFLLDRIASLESLLTFPPPFIDET